MRRAKRLAALGGGPAATRDFYVKFYRKWLLGIGFVLIAASASGHDLRPIFIDISQASETTATLRWKVPATVPRPQLPEIALHGGCAAASEPRVVLRADSYQGERSYDCATELAGTTVSLDFPAVNPSLTTIVRAQTHDGQLLSGLLPPDETAWLIPEAPGRWEVARNYTVLGIEHIAVGWDHLLFVALMVLLARSPRRTLIMVTGFTVAHSLTLALSTLDLVSLPIPVVEAVIALSIVFLATEIARGDASTLAHRHPLLVTGVFGLLHGFGFASVLREVGLPPTELPTALLFFNVGVEIGQIAFVVVIYAAGLGWQAAMRRSRSGRGEITNEGSAAPASPHNIPATAVAAKADALAPLATAYAVGAIASFWTIERLLSI